MLTHDTFLAAGIGGKLNPWCGVVIFPMPVELHANTTTTCRVVSISNLCHLRIGKPDMSFGNDRGIKEAIVVDGSSNNLERQCCSSSLCNGCTLLILNSLLHIIFSYTIRISQLGVGGNFHHDKLLAVDFDDVAQLQLRTGDVKVDVNRILSSSQLPFQDIKILLLVILGFDLREQVMTLGIIRLILLAEIVGTKLLRIILLCCIRKVR